MKENARKAQGKKKESKGKEGNRKGDGERAKKRRGEKDEKGDESPERNKKISTKHRTADKKVAIPEIGKINRTRDEA